MSALETIEAAIVRLEEVNVAPDYYPDFHPALGTAEAYDLALDKILTLRRTLTAQLAILRGAQERINAQTEKGRGKYQVAWSVDKDALALAHSILGVAA